MLTSSYSNESVLYLMSWFSTWLCSVFVFFCLFPCELPVSRAEHSVGAQVFVSCFCPICVACVAGRSPLRSPKTRRSRVVKANQMLDGEDSNDQLPLQLRNKADGKQVKRHHHRDPEGKIERKKKRRLALKGNEETVKKTPTSLNGIKAAEYLERWKRGDNWKFSKSIQNWILRHMYDRKIVKKNLFKQYVVDYVNSMKGKGRERVIAGARDIVKVSLEEKYEQLEQKLASDQAEDEPTADQQESKGSPAQEDEGPSTGSPTQENGVIADSNDVEQLRKQLRSKHKRAERISMLSSPSEE